MRKLEGQTPIGKLTAGGRHRVTAFAARVIIMDEPTAALNVASAEKVLELIRKLKTQD